MDIVCRQDVHIHMLLLSCSLYSWSYFDLLFDMMTLVVRLVNLAIPGADIVVEANEGDMDKATVGWLSQTYSMAYKRVSAEDRASVATHAVDEAVEGQRMEQLLVANQSLIDVGLLNSWDFDVLRYTHDELIQIVTFMFDVLNIIEEFGVSRAVFRGFMDEISCKYDNRNTYHNFKHGVDVCHTVYRLVTVPGLNVAAISHLEFFSLLVGALGHDVGHPGVNNVYLIKAKHPLALQHNDKSPLENMHCSLLYQILQSESCNIFSSLSDQQWRESRKLILEVILGTDMLHHNEQIKKTNVRNK
jgi:3'5'-cyclic nucleotide phosphodiesterase